MVGSRLGTYDVKHPSGQIYELTFYPPTRFIRDIKVRKKSGEIIDNDDYALKSFLFLLLIGKEQNINSENQSN